MRGFKMKLEGFFEIFEGLVFRGTLTGNVNFQALLDVPVTLTPDGRGEWSLHAIIVPHPGLYWFYEVSRGSGLRSRDKKLFRCVSGVTRMRVWR